MFKITEKAIAEARDNTDTLKAEYDRLDAIRSTAFNQIRPLKRSYKASGEDIADDPAYKAYTEDKERASAAFDAWQAASDYQSGLVHARGYQVAANIAAAIKNDPALVKFEGQPLRYKRVKAAIEAAVSKLGPIADFTWYVDPNYYQIVVRSRGGFETSAWIGHRDHQTGEGVLCLDDIHPDGEALGMTPEAVHALTAQYRSDLAKMRAAFERVSREYGDMVHKYIPVGLDVPHRC